MRTVSAICLAILALHALEESWATGWLGTLFG